MGLYNFTPRFVEPILQGTKLHTIRAPRKYPSRSGDSLFLYVGLRQPGARLLLTVRCTKVEKIRITTNGVWIEGVRLGWWEMEKLASADGFSSYEEMFGFFKERLPFCGNIIHWEKPDGKKG